LLLVRVGAAFQDKISDGDDGVKVLQDAVEVARVAKILDAERYVQIDRILGHHVWEVGCSLAFPVRISCNAELIPDRLEGVGNGVQSGGYQEAVLAFLAVGT
jgi:hypothetical protein